MNIKSIETIAIIGAGWLGSQIKESLEEVGIDVLATRTSAPKDSKMKVLNFPTNDYRCVSQANIFIINIPPSKIQEEDFIKFRNFFNDRTFIFISSTSVFERSQGTVTEDTSPLPSSERGKKNLRLEQIFIDDCIIRCGGLIGPNRHPAKTLQKKSIEGDHYINLIHSEDIIEIIKLVLERNYKGVIHASFPSDMTKKEYYTEYAKMHGLGLPTFLKGETNGLKVNSIVLDQWNYQYRNDLF